MTTETGRTVLAIDAMGGDYGPAVMVPGALDALDLAPDLDLLLVGDPAALAEELDRYGSVDERRVRVVASEGIIPQDAKVRAILREGRGSSLWTALEAVAEHRAHACVSAGNTVALMTLGLKLIGRLDGVQRPALMSHIPSANGMIGLLDLGANLEVDADQLFQFALMGSVVRASEPDSPKQPAVGLLNVGHEDSKGHGVVREAHERLLASNLNYAGFIEGHDIFAGRVDVAVCDGFAGNLILKSSEGLAGMLFREIRRTLGSTWRARLGAALARPALRPTWPEQSPCCVRRMCWRRPAPMRSKHC